MNINPGKLNKRITLLTNEVIDSEMVPKSVNVWAEKKSVNRNEFYASYQSGLNPQIVFRLREKSYKLSLVTDADNQKRYADGVMYDGTTYRIIRTYEVDDIVDLVCS